MGHQINWTYLNYQLGTLNYVSDVEVETGIVSSGEDHMLGRHRGFL